MAKWNKGFISIKKRGMLFKEWCEVNHFEYMIDELDEDYSFFYFGLDLSNLTHGNDKTLRWKCSNPNHPAFLAKTIHRASGQRLVCPYCNGHWLSPLEHSVRMDMPDLVESEWDFEKNEQSPDEVVSGSGKKVWWTCSKCGSSYESSPAHRREGRGCPYCANLKIDPGLNSLAVTHPDLAEEWDYTKNDFTPYDISYGADRYAWWRCRQGHSFRQKVCNRTGSKIGCPYCANNSTSFVEQALHFYLRYAFTDVYNRYRGFGIGYEYDIYMPEEKIVIEYDGWNWHESGSSEHKAKLAEELGLFFIHIVSVRNSTDFKVDESPSGVVITCYAEKTLPSSVDTLVKYVIDLILRRSGAVLDDWSFVDTEQHFSVIDRLYRNGGYIEDAQDVSLADS